MAARVWVESLEVRSLLSGTAQAIIPQVESEPNDTIDVAQALGDPSEQAGIAVTGTIGNSTAGAADVDWFSFTLVAPARVSLALQPRGAQPLNGVLSLYNDDPFDYMDQYDPLGHRLLSQQVGTPGTAPKIERDLGPGTYEVAVSGAGNRDFHPLLAGSGFDGAEGDYLLQIVGDDLPLGPNDGPSVLTFDPAPGAVLASSPLVIRLDLGSSLDPWTVIPGQTVSLTYNPNGSFGDGNDQDVPLAWTNVGVDGTELQLAPAAPLAPGYYRVTLAGDSSLGMPVLADPSGTPLGANQANPQGRDYVETFAISGIEGNTGTGATADDTASGAHDLGTLTDSVVTRVTGTIGDDPYYNSFDFSQNPGNDVDLYHFHISGPGSYAFLAEVFAERIGSPLDPGISLFRLDPTDHLLHFVAGNNNTTDSTNATDSTTPLYSDAMITQWLTAGDYYVAVAGGYNTPSPDEHTPMGTPGVFDPNVSHSAQYGFGTGPYVLNLLVYPTQGSPTVVSSSLSEGAALEQAPTQFTVGFSSPVNLQSIAFQQYLETTYCAISSVYVQGADGTIYHPRLEKYDPATNQATFSMLDRLPAGSYTLHLSGPGGLADLGGNPLVGNDPSGDYAIHFAVAATGLVVDGPEGSHLIEAQLGPDGSQNLGVLFPRELSDGITIVHPSEAQAGQPAEDTTQEYRITILQSQLYLNVLGGPDLPPGARLTILNEEGNPFNFGFGAAGGMTVIGQLKVGTYILRVDGVSSDTAYRLTIKMLGNPGNPAPLLSGPAPALQLHFNIVTTTESPAPGGGPSGGSQGFNGGIGGVTTVFGPSPYAGAALVTLPKPSFTGDEGGASAISPAPSPSIPGINPIGTSPAGSTATAAVARGVTSAFNAVASNLYPTGFAPLAVGPVGGVMGFEDVSGGTQIVQVGLPTLPSPQVAMGLVSLVTLTRMDGLGGEAFQPDEPVGESVPEAVADGVTPSNDDASSADVAEKAHDESSENPGVPLRKLVVPGPVAPAIRPRMANAEADAGDSRATVEHAATIPIAATEGPSTVEGNAPGDEADGGSLAGHGSHWMFLLTSLGLVTVVARRYARSGKAARYVKGAATTPSIFRLLGLRPSRGHSHGMRAGRMAGSAAPGPIAGARPRHFTNP